MAGGRVGTDTAKGRCAEDSLEPETHQVAVAGAGGDGQAAHAPDGDRALLVDRHGRSGAIGEDDGASGRTLTSVGREEHLTALRQDDVAVQDAVLGEQQATPGGLLA